MKKQLVPDYICLHQDTDAFPMNKLSEEKPFEQFRKKQSRCVQGNHIVSNLVQAMGLMSIS